MADEAEIIARLRVVCICRGIRQGRIIDAIRKGAVTVKGVNRASGSGSGGCGATRCRPVIEELLAREAGSPASGAGPK